MHEWWGYIQKDIWAIFAAFTAKDLEYPFALILWITLVKMQLLGVDRRDNITGICYSLYCMASGVVLFFALPGSANSFNNFGLHIALVALFGGISAYRWIHTSEQIKVVSGEASKKKLTSQGLNNEKN